MRDIANSARARTIEQMQQHRASATIEIQPTVSALIQKGCLQAGAGEDRVTAPMFGAFSCERELIASRLLVLST